MSDFECVRLSVHSRVAWVEYDRAPVNAFTQAMVAAVRDAVAAAIADPDVRVIVLASAIPGHFSAGADLRAFKEMRGPQMRRWVALCHDLARLMRNSAKPLLAAIDGTAVGGGLEMTLHCDLRFASPETRLGQPEIRIGFIPPVATTQTLVRLIGRPRAIRYLYDGRMLSAAEALAWGLLDEIVEAEPVRERVQRYAEELAAKPAAALAAIRRTVTLGGGLGFEDGMALELEAAAALADTADFAEGVDAFLAKRPPTWSD